MSAYDSQPDPDDMFAETRMTFGEHIEDLRTHLLRAIKGFLICFLLAFIVAKPILKWIERPVKNQLIAFWERYYANKQKEFLDDPRNRNQPPIRITVRLGPVLKESEKELDLMPGFLAILRDLGADEFAKLRQFQRDDWKIQQMEIVNPEDFVAAVMPLSRKIYPPGLTTLNATEALFVYFKVAMVTGLVLGSPWILLQLWLFIGAGLYPHEKKYVHLFLPFSIGLFIAGVLICEFFVIDKAVEALLWFNEWLDFPPELRLNEWLGFAIMMPLVFGVSFQTPLVMLALQRVGIFTIETYKSKRKISWFVMALFAAVITPSVDPFSMVLLWVPMGLLYEIGIWLCKFLPGRPLIDFEETEADETVEV